MHQKDQIGATLIIFLVTLFVVILPFLNLSFLLTSLLFLTFFAFIILQINLRWGFFLFLILRPILDFSSEMPLFEVGKISINLASLLGVMIISTTLLRIPSNMALLKKAPLLKYWLGFTLILILGTAISFNKTTSISELIRMLTIFSFFILGFIVTRTKKDAFQIAKVILISTMIPLLVALYQLITDSGLTLSYQDVPNRLFGTFAHPNLFAFSLTFSIALSLVMFLVSKKSSRKWFYGLLLLVFTFFLAQTYTRGAWILFVFMILSAGFLKLHKLLVFFVVIFFALYMIAEPVKDRVNSITTLSPYSSISWRFNLWQDAIVYAKEAPLLGHGTGVAEELIQERRGLQLGSPAPHNDFLKILLENGIVGLLAFVAIFASLSKILFSYFLSEIRSKKTSNLSFLVLIFLCFALGLYAASFGDNVLKATALQWSFWAQAGGIMAIIRKK